MLSVLVFLHLPPPSHSLITKKLKIMTIGWKGLEIPVVTPKKMNVTVSSEKSKGISVSLKRPGSRIEWIKNDVKDKSTGLNVPIRFNSATLLSWRVLNDPVMIIIPETSAGVSGHYLVRSLSAQGLLLAEGASTVGWG